VSFHHCMTFHSSTPNRSSSPRISLTVHLQDEGDHWQRALDPDGSPIRDQRDNKVRRTNADEPDHTNPMLCPTIRPVAEDISS
jgi:ectoine hydroxylase-related dioxygenase (phytanoyl-CoA dioxygenase family)